MSVRDPSVRPTRRQGMGPRAAGRPGMRASTSSRKRPARGRWMTTATLVSVGRLQRRSMAPRSAVSGWRTSSSNSSMRSTTHPSGTSSGIVTSAVELASSLASRCIRTCSPANTTTSRCEPRISWRRRSAVSRARGADVGPAGANGGATLEPATASTAMDRNTSLRQKRVSNDASPSGVSACVSPGGRSIRTARLGLATNRTLLVSTRTFSNHASGTSKTPTASARAIRKGISK